MKIFVLLLSFIAFQSNSQDLDYLLTRMPFNSNISLLDSNGFNFTKNYTSSGSSWLIDSFPENVVFKAEMSYENFNNPSQSYKVRIGKGGQIYSLTSMFGESVPPQWVNPNWIDTSFGGGNSFSPWVDEVWQMVCVDGDLNSPPDSMYFIHQSGVYLKTPLQTQPFYSPQVAEYYDSLNYSYTTVNWGQQAHTNSILNTGFTSGLLYYTKYTNIGLGVLQVDNMIYNFGDDNISFLNMPWGGVRNSSLEHFFISTPTNSYSNSPAIYGQGPIVQTSSTGGWVAWSDDSLGGSQVLAMAHPITTNTNNSVFRYGDAGNLTAAWNNRDYHVFEMIRFPSLGQLGFGRSMSFRYFYVLGSDIDSASNTIINNNLILESLDTAYTSNINNVDTIRYHFTKEMGRIESSIDTLYSGLLLRSSPYSDSYPLFNISDIDSNSFISSNPYYLSNKPWDGLLESIHLLGFLDSPCNLFVVHDTICSETDYSFPDGLIVSGITSNMSHVSSLNSVVNGYDSIIYTNVIVNQNVLIYDTLSANSLVIWNGLSLDTSGDYSIVLTSSSGCDSIIYLHLTITANTNILDVSDNQKKILKVTNMLGQEIYYGRSSLLFYIYDDGTVEKRIIIE